MKEERKRDCDYITTNGTYPSLFVT